jgi:Undecaprenyl-phosphate glucose phosphotransferase
MAQDGQTTSRSYVRAEVLAETAPSLGVRPVSPAIACGILFFLDVLALVASAAFSYVVHLIDDEYAVWTDYAFVAAFGILLAINVFRLAGLYEPSVLREPRISLQRVGLSWLCVAAAMIAIGFLTKTSEDYSRGWALLWLGSGLLCLMSSRALFSAQVARWIAQGRLQRAVALVGPKVLVARIAAHFNNSPKSGIKVAGLFSDDEHPGRWNGMGAGNLDDLVARVRRDSIDTVIVALPTSARTRVERIRQKLIDVPVDVRLCPGRSALDLMGKGVSEYAGVPTINLLNRPLSDWRYAVKEVEDRILGSLILALISPVLLLIALLIKLDSPGPVFFRQKRYGYNNQLIEVLKFRSMRNDVADQRAEQLTLRDDPRVTPLGAILRKYSLDELPQFINVVRGEMSIVGPRPHAVSAKAGGYLYQEAVDHYASRHRVKPGITGWAQINGWRGTTDTVRQIEKRVEHDLYYIDNWSLWLDLKIIFMTIFKGFSGEHAY